MKTETYYFAADYHPSITEEFYATGIRPYPQIKMVPLAKTPEEAGAFFLANVEELGDKLPRILYAFKIELPAGYPLYKIQRPVLEGMTFYGSKKTIPPECIKGHTALELDPYGDPKESHFLNTRPYYYPARENDVGEIEKNGINGEEITLAETLEEAAVLGAKKYNTKENGITSLAIIFVNVPISTALEPVTFSGPEGEEMNAVKTTQPIPPEWINEAAIIDFKPGGYFA